MKNKKSTTSHKAGRPPDDRTTGVTGMVSQVGLRGSSALLIKATDFTKSQGAELLILPLRGEVYSKTSFPYRPGDVKRSWAKESDAEVHIFQSSSCRSFKQITKLQRVDEKTHTVEIDGPECIAALGTGDRYFVENVFEELDSPEEWYLNRKTGTLYFWPKKKLTPRSEVVAPRLRRVFQFEGTSANPVRFIRLTGLTIRETDYSPEDGCAGYGVGNNGVVYLQSASECVVARCRFENCGAYAVCLSGGSGNAIVSNDIAFGAEGGILLLNSGGNTISDNHIHHCGQVYKHVGGVMLEGAGSGGNLVAHNAIHDMTRYGISLKNPGRRNVVEYNEIFNVNLETYDTGAIEVTQQDREFRSGSVIRCNLIHDNVGYSSNMGMDQFLAFGIYLDSYAGGYTVSHNISYRGSTGGVMLQGGKDNKVHNNIFIDGGYGQVTIINYANNSTGLEFSRNIVCLSGAQEKSLFVLGAVNRKILQSDRNLFYHADSSTMQNFWFGRWGQGVWSAIDLDGWRKAGYDKRSIVANPLFVSVEDDDYRLKTNSPAFRLGFEPIPVHMIGLLNKRCDCSRRSALLFFDQCQMRCSSCKQRRIGGTPCGHLTST